MNILDQPRYTAAYAGRLIGLKPDRVRRWLKGYEYRYAWPEDKSPQIIRKKPVIKRHEAMRSPYASFLDLIDLLFVKQFLNNGISLQKIRKALKEAESIVHEHHYAQRCFFTDGREIYLQIKASNGNAEALLQLLSGGQWVIAEIIKQLAIQIEFHKETGFAERWYPLGKSKQVVIDPNICFGSPTIIGTGIQTDNIFDLYQAENNIDRVSSWLNLEPSRVIEAIEFESMLGLA